MEIQPYEKNGSLSFFTASNLPRKNQGKEIDCFNEFFAITKKIMRSLGFRYKSISFLFLRRYRSEASHREKRPLSASQFIFDWSEALVTNSIQIHLWIISLQAERSFFPGGMFYFQIRSFGSLVVLAPPNKHEERSSDEAPSGCFYHWFLAFPATF